MGMVQMFDAWKKCAEARSKLIARCESERDALRAELDALKGWGIDGKYTSIIEDRNALKAKAEKLAEALRDLSSITIKCEFDEAKAALAAYEGKSLKDRGGA